MELFVRMPVAANLRQAAVFCGFKKYNSGIFSTCLDHIQFTV
jgi:hypothetical protein